MFVTPQILTNTSHNYVNVEGVAQMLFILLRIPHTSECVRLM